MNVNRKNADPYPLSWGYVIATEGVYQATYSGHLSNCYVITVENTSAIPSTIIYDPEREEIYAPCSSNWEHLSFKKVNVNVQIGVIRE